MIQSVFPWIVLIAIPAAFIGGCVVNHNLEKRDNRVIYMSMGRLLAWHDIFFAAGDNPMHDDYAALIQDIQWNGIKEPLTVRRTKGGRYQVIEGFRRYTAASLLDIPKVPVLISKATDKEALEMWLTRNKAREHTEKWQSVYNILQKKCEPAIQTHEGCYDPKLKTIPTLQRFEV